MLGKNINMALVGLILILVLIATGTTVLYQRGLQERTRQYEETSANLSQCRAQVENFKSELEKQQSKLNATSQDIAKYDTLYGQRVAELNQVRDELAATKSSLNAMTLQKEQFKKLYSTALINISSLNNQITALENQVEVLREQKAHLETLLAECDS